MSMGRTAVLCAVGVVSLGAFGVSQERAPLGTMSIERAGAREETPAAGTSTEEEWIVADVTTAIHQMVAHGMRRPPRPGSATVQTALPARGTLATFNLRVPGSEPARVAVTDHIWAPGAFAQFAAPLATGAGERCRPSAPAPVIASMLAPEAPVIVRESARISARLSADMRCADAHHEAALLLGTLALREAAGPFSDVRRIVSRMTAHLAVAEAVQPGGSSVVSQLANATLLTLAGRQRSALAALDAFDAQPHRQDVQAWIRALRVRNTSDWRAVPDGKNATLLEQFSVLRAMKTSLGNGPALKYFYSLENPAEVADWARLLLQASPSVEGGNRFSQHWLSAELSEASEVLKALHDKAIVDREAIARELNAEAGAGPVGSDGAVAVIDWGMWAAAAQRHLLAAVNTRHTHLARSLGLPGDARAFRDDASRVFVGLRLYPLAAVAIAYDRDEAARAFVKVTPLVRTRPELVTDGTWRILQRMAQWAVVPIPGKPKAWFTPVLPAGTVFDVDSRSQPDEKEPRFTAAQVADLRARAPYSRRLAEEAVRWKGEKPSYEVLRSEYGELASYDLEFATALAKSAWDRPDIYIPQMEVACRMSADAYWDLAPYLADRGRTDEARRAYERWLDEGQGQVAISNGMDWLVRHYFERGEHDKAVVVADRVKDVGSYWGLVTRANLHDWDGELDEAERVYRHAWKRYDNPNELLAFYLRHGRKGPEVDELIQKVFPSGLTRSPGSPGPAAPRDGVVVVFPGFRGSQQGLRADDVITRVDGIRVRNVPQYRAARGGSADPVMRLTVWRGGQYLEIPARLRYGWVVSTVKTYEPGAAN